MAGKKEVETKDAKKAQALNDAIKQIEKQFGKGSVMKLGDRAAVDVAVIPTGSLTLDMALGIGGYPKAMSSVKEPVGITATSTAARSPSFITEPFPNCFSICLIASFNACAFLASFVSTSFFPAINNTSYSYICFIFHFFFYFFKIFSIIFF